MPTPDELRDVAQEVANHIPHFWDGGPQIPRAFLNALWNRLHEMWPQIEREKHFEPAMPRCAFDFYIGDQQLAVEVALSGHSSGTEYFKDLWKAVLANQPGSLAPAKTVLFLGKHPIGQNGIVERLQEPFPQRVKNLCAIVHQLAVEVRAIEQQH